MIALFIEMIQLPNYGHMTTFTISFESFVDDADDTYHIYPCHDIITFVSNYICL